MNRQFVTAEKLAGTFSISPSKNVESSGISNFERRLPTVANAAKALFSPCVMWLTHADHTPEFDDARP
jgi:hypothetical protein